MAALPSVQVPVPFLVSVPVVVAITPVSEAVPVPVKLRLVAVPVIPPENVVNPPVPEASIVLPLAIVIARLVESVVLPTYCSVPVALIEIAGVVDPVPIELAVPESANLLTLNIPPEIIV